MIQDFPTKTLITLFPLPRLIQDCLTGCFLILFLLLCLQPCAPIALLAGLMLGRLNCSLSIAHSWISSIKTNLLFWIQMRRPLLLLCPQLVPPRRQESLAQVSTFSHLSQEDSFAPRFYFDLSCLSHQEWRASHAISHHLHTNSLTDVEVDVNNRKQKLSFLDIGSEPNWQVTAVEPFLSFLPESKNLLQVSFFLHQALSVESWK